jgi:hypothetical protein
MLERQRKGDATQQGHWRSAQEISLIVAKIALRVSS